MTSHHTDQLGCATPVTLIGLPPSRKIPPELREAVNPLIAKQIVLRPGPLRTEDIRFLRTYLGMKVLAFKKELGLGENDDIRALAPDAEARLRVLACHKVCISPPSREVLEDLPMQPAKQDYAISIDVSDSGNYRLLN